MGSSFTGDEVIFRNVTCIYICTTYYTAERKPLNITNGVHRSKESKPFNTGAILLQGKYVYRSKDRLVSHVDRQLIQPIYGQLHDRSRKLFFLAAGLPFRKAVLDFTFLLLSTAWLSDLCPKKRNGKYQILQRTRFNNMHTLLGLEGCD